MCMFAAKTYQNNLTKQPLQITIKHDHYEN